MNKPYRHGDLSFHVLNEKPKGMKPELFSGTFVLALGEATGHSHRLVATKDAVKLYRDEHGVLVLEVRGKAIVEHEEHKTLTLVPGWYRLGNEREFNYWENATQRVID